jgi:hypothetical protein
VLKAQLTSGMGSSGIMVHFELTRFWTTVDCCVKAAGFWGEKARTDDTVTNAIAKLFIIIVMVARFNLLLLGRQQYLVGWNGSLSID